MKLKRVGFTEVEVVERRPFGMAQAEQLLPLLTTEVIDLMRRLIPADRQDQIAVSTTFTARNPS